MNRWMTLLLLCAVAAPGHAASRFREIEKRFEYRSGQEIVVEYPIGELRIEGTDGDAVELELDARCNWGSSCGLDDLRVEDRSSERALHIRVVARGTVTQSKREIRTVLRVPRQAALDVEMSIGQLELRDVESDVHAELGIGEIKVYAAESRTRSVYLDAGIGEARLRGSSDRVRSSRPMLIGSEVDWSYGDGDAVLDLSVGIGEVTVHLD